MAKTKKQIKLRFFMDPIGNTLNVWWENPNCEAYSDFSDYSDDVIIYNKNNKPIGLEKINFFPEEIKNQLVLKAVQSYLKLLAIPKKEVDLLLQK